MSRIRGRLLRELAPPLIVLIVASYVLADAASRVVFSETYNRADSYFDLLFLEQDLSDPAWWVEPRTHQVPMLTRYIVGGWQWAREEAGRPRFNARAIRTLQKEAGLPGGGDETSWMSAQVGLSLPDTLRERPSPGQASVGEQLREYRAPMVVLSVGAVLALYALGRLLANQIAGLVAVTLALGSPAARESFVRTGNESPLMFFLLVALLLAVLGARRGRRGALPVGWAVATGVPLGLALQAKLTAVLAFSAVGAWGVLVAGLVLLHDRNARGAWKVGRGWLLALVVAFGVFTATNPHLYPNPIQHTAHMFQERIVVLLAAQERRPADALLHLPERARFALEGSLIDYTFSGSHGLPLEAVLVPIGAVVLLLALWGGLRRTGEVAPEGLIVLTALATFAGTSVFGGMAWPRYVVPALLLGTLLSGVALSVAIGQLLTLARASGRAGVSADGVALARGMEGQPSPEAEQQAL